MDRITGFRFFGFGKKRTEKWIKRKFGKLIFLFFPLFWGAIFDDSRQFHSTLRFEKSSKYEPKLGRKN